MPAGTHDLAELLDLEEIDLNLFRGKQSDTDRQRVFGGQVAAQAMIAGVRTRRPGVRHPLAALLLPAARATPRCRSCTTWSGSATADRSRPAGSPPRQHGRPIFYLTANFQREEEGLEHQDVMPEVPGRRRASRWST